MQDLRFCKIILGGSEKSCSNVGILGDLGGSPLELYCLHLMFMYLHRLLNFKESGLVNKALSESMNLNQNKTFSWVSSTCQLPKTFGLDYNLERHKRIKIRTLKTSYDNFWSDTVKSPIGTYQKEVINCGRIVIPNNA